MEEQKNNNQESSYWGEKTNLEGLLRENIRYSKAILVDTQKMRRYMLIRMIFNIIWIVLILAPVLLAFFWLPSAIGGMFTQVQEITGSGQGTVDLLQQLQQLR